MTLALREIARTPHAQSNRTKYSYDRRNRLSSWAWNGSAKHFRFDALGNLTHKGVSNPTEAANLVYGDAARPHAVTQHTPSGKSFEYDADGNLTRRGGQHLKYDSANRLQCVGSTLNACDIAQYAYDVDGVLIYEFGQTTRVLFEDLFIWEQGTAISTVFALGRSLGERHRTNATLRTAWLPSNWDPPIDPWLLAWLGATSGGVLLLLLAARAGVLGAAARRPVSVSVALLLGISMGLPPEAAMAGGGGPIPARRWTYQDHLGNRVLYLNDTPDLIYRRVFEPYGGVAAESVGTALHERIFTGKREDADTRVGSESGLIHFGARWYDAEIGRFLSIDPIVQTLGDPQTHNPYSYVRNNPVNLTDPDGRGTFDIAQIVIGVIGIVYGIVTGNPFMVANSINLTAQGLEGAGHGEAATAVSLTGLSLGAVGGISGASSPDWQDVVTHGGASSAEGSDVDSEGILDFFEGFGVRSKSGSIGDLDDAAAESREMTTVDRLGLLIPDHLNDIADEINQAEKRQRLLPRLQELEEEVPFLVDLIEKLEKYGSTSPSPRKIPWLGDLATVATLTLKELLGVNLAEQENIRDRLGLPRKYLDRNGKPLPRPDVAMR